MPALPALGLASSLNTFWYTQGKLREGISWIERARDGAPDARRCTDAAGGLDVNGGRRCARSVRPRYLGQAGCARSCPELLSTETGNGDSANERNEHD